MRFSRLHLTDFFLKRKSPFSPSIILPSWKKNRPSAKKESVFSLSPLFFKFLDHSFFSFSFLPNSLKWRTRQERKKWKGDRYVSIWLKRAALKELARAMFKPLYEQSEMLGLDWQAMLVWMAAGQSYPCLLLYAHCVHCTRAPASTQHCDVQHCDLTLLNLLAILCYPLGYNSPILCTLRRS